MAGEWTDKTTFADLIEEGALEIGDGYRAKNEELGGHGLIFLRAGHVTDSHINFSGVERFHAELEPRVRSKLSKPGDAVVTTKGNSTGRTTFVTLSMPPFVYSPHLSYWRTKDRNRVEGGFLRYWSKGSEFSEQLAGMAASTDMAPYLSLIDQKRLRISLPPIEEQRAIAHILGTLDDKIELNRRMNETLEAMARALFKSWFIDFDPVRRNAVRSRNQPSPRPTSQPSPTGRGDGDEGVVAGLAYDHLFPDSFEDSALGKIPKGWKVDVLENALITLEVGGRPKGGVSGYTEGVPSIGAESIVGLGVFDYSKTKYVPWKFFDGMTKGHVKSRDVLLYKDGGRPGEYEPHITMFGNGFPFTTFAINEHVYRLRAKPEMGQNFLFFSLSSDFLMEEMRIKGTGVAIPGLNSTQVKSLTTLIPAREPIRAFDAIVEPWIARLLAGCNESRTLATLRDSLLPKLISGELRVKNAVRIVERTAV